MARQTARFVNKRPHRKSRSGCTTCKRKKIKCDEALPKCTYCSRRKLECLYPAHEAKDNITAVAAPQASALCSGDSIPNPRKSASPSLEIPPWLAPMFNTAAGPLTKTEMGLIHLYRTHTYKTLTVSDEPMVLHMKREWVPNKALAYSFLLYTMLSVAATHSNTLSPSAEAQYRAHMYRQKMLTAYNAALQNINPDNYEALLLNSLVMQIMVPRPEIPCDDSELLDWISMILSMNQGLKSVAAMQLVDGIEQAAAFNLLRKRLRVLPPPPATTPGPGPYLFSGSVSPTPEEQLQSQPVFLPPPLLALLGEILDSYNAIPFDPLVGILLPALHALSPIFLSFYHYHLHTDTYTRIIAFPTLLSAEFIDLVRSREPRALTIMGWWFTLHRLLPGKVWWFRAVIPSVLDAIHNIVLQDGRIALTEAVERACEIIRIAAMNGREAAAMSLFERWDGVEWNDGGRYNNGNEFSGYF